MNTKVLKLVRKFYEYIFLKNGEIAVRNKKTGKVRIFINIEDFIWWISEASSIVSKSAIKRWRIKRGKTPISNDELWESLKKKYI